MLKIVTLPVTTSDIGEICSSQHSKDKHDHRVCVLKILSNIRFLGRQGLPLRGAGNGSNSNFVQLFKLRAEDDPRLLDWFARKTDKYTSGEIQNRILKVMAQQVLAKVESYLHSAPSLFYTIMVDETTDISNHEQVVVCIRWVDNSFEEFITLEMTCRIDADLLVSVIKGVLKDHNLSVSKLRGQCYDGAATMAGAKAEVAKKLLDEEPRAVYTHCYGHALNLACGDTIKCSKLMKDALDTTHEIVKLLKRSPKRDTCFVSLKADLAPDTAGIRVLCPTRWTVWAESLRNIIDNYEVLNEVWVESLEEVTDTEIKARIRGVQSQMSKFDFYYGVMLGELILCHTDNLSRTLQNLKYQQLKDKMLLG